MEIKNKGKSKRGFTLVEMLAAIVVLCLMCVGVWSGLSAVSNVYAKMMFQSNSQILEDTIDTEFLSVLRHAKVDAVDPAGEGKSGRIHLTTNRNLGLSGGGYIDLAKKSSDDSSDVFYAIPDDTSELSQQYLVNPGAYLGMDIEDYSLTYDEDSKVFTGNYTIVSANGKLQKACEFKCTSLIQE